MGMAFLNPKLNNDHLKKHYNKTYKDYKKSKKNFIYQDTLTQKLDNI